MKLIALNPISHGFVDNGRLQLVTFKPGEAMDPDLFSEKELESLVASGSASVVADPHKAKAAEEPADPEAKPEPKKGKK